MPAEVRSAIRGFIAQRYPNIEFSDTDDIFALGLVNSLFAMELVMFIEQRFEMKLANDELRLENFRTVEAMSRLVERQAAASHR